MFEKFAAAIPVRAWAALHNQPIAVECLDDFGRQDRLELTGIRLVSLSPAHRDRKPVLAHKDSPGVEFHKWSGKNSRNPRDFGLDFGGCQC